MMVARLHGCTFLRFDTNMGQLIRTTSRAVSFRGSPPWLCECLVGLTRALRCGEQFDVRESPLEHFPRDGIMEWP